MATEIVGLLHHTLSDDGETVTLAFAQRNGQELLISMPSNFLGGIRSALGEAEREAKAKRDPSLVQDSYRLLKTWAVGPHPHEDAVLVRLDRDTPLESNFALSPDTAREFGAALLDKSQVVLGRTKPRAH